MAKLAAPKKPTAKAAPKKPTSRSKTGNAECSAAASNWQLAIRGKASLSPDTYQTLAKCRALSSTKKKADAYGRTGKLSDMGAAALSARADKRFSQGLVTQKSRTDRLNMLLKQRAEQQNAKPSTVVNKTIGLRKDGLMTSGHIRAMKAEPKGTGESSFEVWKSTQMAASSEQAKRSAKAGMLLKQRSQRGKAETAVVAKPAMTISNQTPKLQDKQALIEQRTERNQAELTDKLRLKKPIVGPTGNKIVGYQWVNETVDGMYGDRKISDWSNAQTSVPTGRSIVHLFWVQGKEGAPTLMGRGAAQKELGISESRLVTIAKKEAARQKYAAEMRKLESDRREKSGQDSAKMAIGEWVSNPSHKGLGWPPRVLLKNGKFTATIQPDTIENLKENGWTLMASGRGTSQRSQKAEFLLKKRKERGSVAPSPVQPGSGEAISSKPAARYSLGGKLAPGRGTEERKKIAGVVRSLRTGDAQTAAGTLKSAGLVAIPSKFDAKKVAIKERDLWNAYTPREAAYRILATRTLAGPERKRKNLKRIGWVTP